MCQAWGVRCSDLPRGEPAGSSGVSWLPQAPSESIAVFKSQSCSSCPSPWQWLSTVDIEPGHSCPSWGSSNGQPLLCCFPLAIWDFFRDCTEVWASSCSILLPSPSSFTGVRIALQAEALPPSPVPSPLYPSQVFPPINLLPFLLCLGICFLEEPNRRFQPSRPNSPNVYFSWGL